MMSSFDNEPFGDAALAVMSSLLVVVDATVESVFIIDAVVVCASIQSLVVPNVAHRKLLDTHISFAPHEQPSEPKEYIIEISLKTTPQI